MSKNSMVTALAQELNISKKAARASLAAVLGMVSTALVAGERVTLTGFGTFVVRDRKSRNGINPQTKQPLTIPEHKVAGFIAGKDLKRAINK